MASSNTRGAIFMATAMGGFACNDAMLKFTFETMPLAQGVFMRGAFATVIVALMAWRAGALFYRPRREERLPLVVRTIGELGATASFMVAIANMPIAAATAVLQAAPLAVTLTAAVLLAEPVGWRRWTAILVGFGGVLLMIRPGTDDFNAFAAVAFVTVCFIVLRDLGTRAMGPRVPTLFASFLTASSVTLTAALVVPFEGWKPMDGVTVALYAGAAAFVIVGYVTITIAMRLGDVAFVSPFRYAVLLWALILGLVVFGEVPQAPTLAGAAIVVAAGLYTLWRERVVAKRRLAATAPTRPFAPSRGEAGE